MLPGILQRGTRRSTCAATRSIRPMAAPAGSTNWQQLSAAQVWVGWVGKVCFFRPASRKSEIVDLAARCPGRQQRALDVEDNARPNLTTVKGLGKTCQQASTAQK